MFNKIILIFVFTFFFTTRLVLANSIIINEFVSDPSSGPEWIELLNTSASSVDLSSWRWTELASPGGDTEHEGTPKSLSGNIPPGAVFVFEMNSALNNAGDSIGLYNGTDLEDRVTFGKVRNFAKDLGVPAKGKSGAYIDGEWQTNQEPTKGMQNPGSASFPDSETNSDEDSDFSTSSEEKEEELKAKTAIQKTEVQITARSLAYVGVPFALEGKVFSSPGEQLFTGKYFWNFGDGDFRESKVINTDKFSHTYFYPGDYTILLEHYPNFFTEVSDASEKLIIKVIVPEIFISSVGNKEDFFVEITNNTEYSADLSGWYLLGGQKSFLIPKNTTISARGKMIISPKITHFTIEEKNNLKLMTSAGELASVFPFVSESARKAPAGKMSASTSSSSKNELVPVKNLDASVIESNIVDSARGAPTSFPVVPTISFLFIGTSAGIVYFIRRKKVTEEPGSDFEILDE